MHRPPATFQVDGTAIRKRRMELGLTRDNCASKAGISGPYLSQLETGARRVLRPPTYKRLRTVLKVPTTDRRLLAQAEDRQEEESNVPGDCAPREEEAG
ncbi:helix-turn-helix domain-containing protein [Streptomyces sp. STCH 565 A]|uniref:helix-turn-helix domain-containing protein n=1 Tax=Streptomyces sp. STCH 565 A TaxID=2950532 RepID=UPI002075E37B|nr:helix-turn-helix transcriptional regulator [Streptomyces sp. STCH 565 A]MCM8548960.1 helix-turn-helix domain-containing protein [Streptomyces sp. STCH 565 A]